MANGKLCGAKLKGGREGTCKNPAGSRTDHLGWGKCQWHGGTSPALRVAAAREQLREQFLGNSVDIEPTEAMLEEIRRSAGHVRWLHENILRFGNETQDDPQRALLQLSEQGWSKAAWMKLYSDERTHLMRTAKMALDAGVAERSVKLAESQGELIAVALRGILNELGLTTDQEQRAPGIVAKHLRAVS